ncbi:MAG: oligosaccharide repeat unit polymerase, partial [Clostridia bacterium]|nr:oligosaccharide repeat unit polymerase [Clostridia bacterium]
MYFLYLITSIAELIVAAKIYRKIVNPVVLYVLPWLLSVSLYEMKLIKYYTLSLTTWLIIILFQGLFFACCFVFKEKKEAKVRDYCHSLDSRTVFWTIMALTAFSALAIMPNFIFFLHRYGITFMSKFSEVYNDRLNGNAPFSIPYIGVFIYLCVVLTGIYYKKYGFNFYLFIPLGLAVIDSIQGGGRSGLVLIFLLFVVPYLFVQKDTKKVKKNKNWIWIAAFLFLVVAAFVLVTRERSWIDENHEDYRYMSDTMKSLIKISPSIYKNYAYFSSPIGVLNAYLENPDFTFGKNSLSFFISFLNKFGADLPYARYQDYYYVPIHTNVGTYIREIIQDYYYFAPLVLIAFTLLFSKAYALLRRGNPFGEILFSIMGVSVVMSFFVCYYRESVFWIMLIEIPMFHYIYRLIRKKIHGASFLSAEPGDGAGPAEEAPPSGDAVDVSVVFVNYFTCDLTCQAIASVRERSRGFTYEIIVVDNSCDEAEFARLTERLQGLATVIDAKGNLGFGRANNLAATKAKGKYLFFLNTDTLLLNNAIFELYAFLEQNPRAGVAGG